MPKMRFSKVVLPQPEGPRMETISPSSTCIEISFNTVTPSKDF